MKRCPACRKTLDPSAFNFDKRKRDGLRGYCKVCQRKAAKASRDKARVDRADPRAPMWPGFDASAYPRWLSP